MINSDNIIPAAGSAATRFLLSRTMGLSNKETVIFNALDMTIGSIAAKLMPAERSIAEGRILGFLASAVITHLVTDTKGVIPLIAASIMGQACGHWLGNNNGGLPAFV